MEIRQTNMSDLFELKTIFSKAQHFMHDNGNNTQWTDLDGLIELVVKDIKLGNSYVCVEENDIVATFAYFIGEDPTYKHIYEGAWLDNDTYGVMHRVASSGKVKGAGSFCINWCFNNCHNLRIDTHEKNYPMQQLLLKNKFKKCGIIYIENGDERVAFQKNKASSIV